MRVENMKSARGNDVPNQFIIQIAAGLVFQSYNTVIAVKYLDGQVELDANSWDRSVTTGKYRNQFLGETRQETVKKIKDGTYKLVNLNR
jgi:hypothetical protein